MFEHIIYLLVGTCNAVTLNNSVISQCADRPLALECNFNNNVVFTWSAGTFLASQDGTINTVADSFVLRERFNITGRNGRSTLIFITTRDLNGINITCTDLNGITQFGVLEITGACKDILKRDVYILLELHFVPLVSE